MASLADEPRSAGWTVGKRLSMRWRGATGPARTLPDFLVIGAARAGSTSLFAILTAHPQVLPPSHKELHFFDRNYPRGLAHYRRMFPLESHRRLVTRRLGRPVLTGEATTYYLFHPAVPERVARELPDVRLVAILRDPVDRAYSHYQLSVRNGHEPLSFEDALDAEDGRLAGEEERLAADPAYRSPAHAFNSYVSRGLYLPQLERWHRHVARERLLVLRSEDLFERPTDAVEEVTSFLDLAPHPGPLPAPRNRAEYGGMSDATRERLRRRFEEPNRRLEAYLGRELRWQRPA
ncbi:MAG: sulfotransferase domain-containing protein [Gaiellales bacterium]